MGVRWWVTGWGESALGCGGGSSDAKGTEFGADRIAMLGSFNNVRTSPKPAVHRGCHSPHV
jgi:hypothetical protein